MSKNSLQFKISSALKNIIGSDLINDDFIAVFELVKNSYDAHASKVLILFENIYSDKAKIIIKDNGKGMSYDDLNNKWLFVAYSAKKEGTEEDSYGYRNQIKNKRAYAGAKGIGRFSCDRLGGELYLETIKDEPNSKVETILTEWDKFEGDLKEEFVNISVIHETIPKSNYNQKNGTVLEISNLKSEWNKSKLLALKDALAKLINPNTQFEDDGFNIEISVPDEIENDKKESKYNKIVNGNVQNLIFETLDIKTTKIVTKVSDKNTKQIETSLYEGGKLVYKILEVNPFENLNNVEGIIYYMNRSAKLTFSRRMGIAPVEYGHVFVYKNGLRIYPYGERGADPLRMDNRKAQGRTRYIGTRETVGFISINDPNEELRETSSRGDGLIKSPAYFDLYEWFYYTLKRVEKYIIDIVDWGNELSNDDFIKLSDNAKQNALEKLITNLTRTKGLISFDVAPEIFELLDAKQEFSAQSKLSKISKELERDDFNKVAVKNSLKEIEKELGKLKKVSDEAGEEAFDKLIENEELNENLESEKKRGAFQGSLIGTDKERIIGLQHQIFHSSGRVHRNVKLLLKHLGFDRIDKKTEKYIKIISLEAFKINSIANFITKANFNLKASEIEQDLVGFITDYISEMYILDEAIIDTELDITINTNNIKFKKEFRPLEITTVIDNLISNAERERTNASRLVFDFSKGKDNSLEIEITDNGDGVPQKSLNNIFKFGFTTSEGSGIGLYQIKDIIENKMKGKVIAESKIKEWTKFKIKIP